MSAPDLDMGEKLLAEAIDRLETVLAGGIATYQDGRLINQLKDDIRRVITSCAATARRVAEMEALAERRRTALGWFLADERFDVHVGGNPTLVDTMLKRAQEIYMATSAFTPSEQRKEEKGFEPSADAIREIKELDRRLAHGAALAQASNTLVGGTND
jgi:hypothetical protein